MTLRIPLVNGEYATILSSYAPTPTSEENQKDAFYEQLHQALSVINKDDEIILMGYFNAQVGREASVWHGAIGRNGESKMKNEQQQLASSHSVLRI